MREDSDRAGEPLDAVMAVPRETRWRVLSNGFMARDDVIAGWFSGTVRKPTAK